MEQEGEWDVILCGIGAGASGTNAEVDEKVLVSLLGAEKGGKCHPALTNSITFLLPPVCPALRDL